MQPRALPRCCSLIIGKAWVVKARQPVQPIHSSPANQPSQPTMMEVVRQPSILLGAEDVGSDSGSDFDQVLDSAVRGVGSSSLAGHPAKSNVVPVKKLKHSTDQSPSPVGKRQVPAFKVRSKPAFSDQDEQGSHNRVASPESGFSDTTAMAQAQPVSDDGKRQHKDQLMVTTSTDQHLTGQNSIDSSLMSPSSFIGLVAAAGPTSQPNSSASHFSTYIKAPARPAARQVFKQYIQPPVQMRQRGAAMPPSNSVGSAGSKYEGVRSAAFLPRSGDCSPCLSPRSIPSLSMNAAALQAGLVGLARGY